tara:strand:- start:1175 stop:1543 length:369 start_codon:yes stop_codon:yes gene_type:complete
MMSDLMEDKLDCLAGKEACPVCGSIAIIGTARCLECGTFHSGIHLEDREPPPPEERLQDRDIDPSDYSIDPSTAIAVEEFESDESSVKKWSGGTSDFSFTDDADDVTTIKQAIPDSDILLSD